MLRMPPFSSPSSAHPAARVRKLPLQAHSLLAHAAAVHPGAAVVSLSALGREHRSNYAELARGAARRAGSLRALGVVAGDTLCSLGLSSIDQLETLYASLSLGACTHLLNPQFEPSQALGVVRRSAPRWLLHDASTAAMAQHLHGALEGTAGLLCTSDAWAGAPAAPGVDVDEESAALACYSSGTTGMPKTVVYSHRSTVLHAWACALPDALNLSAADRVMPLMQLYHATAWGAPFVCPLVGAALVLVPPHRDPAQWYHWIEDQGITVLGAVSAHWQALASHMRAHGLRFSSLQRTVVGGTRLAPELAQQIAGDLGVEVRHAWGMTETSPLATVEVYRCGSLRLGHGKPVFGIELDVSGDASPPLGELRVRGHWVAPHEGDPTDWLATGDLAARHADGGFEVLDRLADAVARPGLLLSSAVVEHAARGVAGVADAALLALHDTANRSALALVLSPGSDAAATLARVAERLASVFNGWRPDELIEIDSFPYTPSVKVQKHLLRPRLLAALNTAAG